MREPGNRDNGASDVWALTAYTHQDLYSQGSLPNPTRTTTHPGHYPSGPLLTSTNTHQDLYSPVPIPTRIPLPTIITLQQGHQDQFTLRSQDLHPLGPTTPFKITYWRGVFLVGSVLLNGHGGLYPNSITTCIWWGGFFYLSIFIKY